MKACTLLPMLSFVLMSSTAALAQDPVKVDPAHYKVVLENATVRILKIDYPVGAKSKMHQHPDAIVVSLSDSKVRFTMPDGKSEDVDMASGGALYTPAMTHNPANAGKQPVDALLIEFKKATPGTATIPSSRESMSMKMLAEAPQATAFQITADPSFQEAAGTSHTYDQIVIALGPSPMSLSIDGKPAKTSWKRGDVQFIGRGVAHESRNPSGKPIDFIIIAVK
jgi:beta-alanine degradation protein BauB